MDYINDLFINLIKYFQYQCEPINKLEFFVTYIIPILQILLLIFSAIAGIYKYYKSKNREIYEKNLKEVYAPLYNYFIKQELLCELYGWKRDITKSPILEIKRRNVVTKYFEGGKSQQSEVTEVLDLSKKKFIQIFKSVNCGLTDKELYTLFSMYETVEDFISGRKHDEAYCEAIELNRQLENRIREKVIRGYNYYQKKLGLSKDDSTFYKIDDSSIEFTYKIDPEKVNAIKEQVKEEDVKK